MPADDPSRTRPGTPMTGPYSTAQMDDFYAALGAGQVKTTGVMNLMQHLLVAERCRPGDDLVDVCCGRGLALPLLRRYCPGLGSYTGIDISDTNLDEASHGRDCAEFPVVFHQADVAAEWPVTGPFDVAVYTSALEHLPYERGLASLRRTADALADGGRIFLSTPNTPGPAPRPLQHRVHVYEWSHEEVVAGLRDAGFDIDRLEVIGLLPPDTPVMRGALRARYGVGAALLYDQMLQRCPSALLDPVISTGLGEAAGEVLYVCPTRSTR
ncbi:class I SAM-dependent methyltransferase [Pseudonocardia sp. HH130630-07]|uniref:class I SAM-dependent methyltransferase n=1 Tax=Pseudonocardia sp. HH130630-07 TaxID=1690815 RepID=UPI0018D2D779|nr:class I SAM-dependent methyltransferase [Pseudonocardia sp. HH130630-07]